ncbi:hypothetical protein [Azospirillum halopraeferens]|uniref:hypothetical protein n=1 Tax=Azospirillum halopraeferens TaxID=34010 RepID=UPI00042327AA|nr:hypothetical protein [Azospirillum halopraeferens]
MLSDLKARLTGQRLSDPAYAFLLEPAAGAEPVALQIEATSRDAARADLRAVAAVPIRGHRILASGALRLSFWPTEPAEPALDRLLRFVANRPLVGHDLDFTLGVLDRMVQPMIGIALPNPRIEVSGLYYDRKRRSATRAAIDLRLDAILRDLDLPVPDDGTAYAAALAAAMAYLRLQ